MTPDSIPDGWKHLFKPAWPQKEEFSRFINEELETQVLLPPIFPQTFSLSQIICLDRQWFSLVSLLQWICLLHQLLYRQRPGSSLSSVP